MISSLASKCQDFKFKMPFFQPLYVMKLKTSKLAFCIQWRYHYQIQVCLLKCRAKIVPSGFTNMLFLLINCRLWSEKKIPTSIFYWNWYTFLPNRVCRVWYVKVNLIIRWNNNKRSKNTDISILNNSPGTEVGICFHCGGFTIATMVNQSYGKLHRCAVHSTNSKVFWTDFRQLFLQCTFSSVSTTILSLCKRLKTPKPDLH